MKLRTLLLTCALALASLTSAKANSPALDLQQYAGKVVVIDFWASWCTPCRKSFPWLNTMQAKYADQGLVVIGVNVDEELAAAKEFLRDVPAQFQIHYDTSGQLAKKYEVLAMPSSYILDRQGNLVKTHLGFKSRNIAEYEKILVEQLNQKIN